MDQAELYGRVIKVNPAKPQKDVNEGLGSRTAVWEQVCIFHSLTTILEANKAALQDGYATKYNVGEADDAEVDGDTGRDPMQGLEGLDEAGPRAQ